MVSFPEMKGMFDKKGDELHGMVVVDFNDHEFAKFLRDQNPNWTYDSIAEYNRFISDGVVIAIVKYKNDYPLARKIWINKNLIKGYIILHDPTKSHKEKDKAYTRHHYFPCNMEPNSVIYEDEQGPYWLREDLRKEGKI